MKNVWFQIWLVGNGGRDHSHKFVFWPDYSDDHAEMSGMVEHELSPFPSSIRSIHWAKKNPPDDVVEARIKDIKRKLERLKKELKHHEEYLSLD